MIEKNIIVNPTMSMDKIQSYLKKNGCTIKFTKGTYSISKTLTLYSNTNIILDKATLIRKTSSHIFRGYLNPNISYNYNAVQNITISGGILIGDGIKKTGSIFGFMHGNNILIKDMQIKNVYKSHGFDLCACKNVTLKNIKFSGRITDQKIYYKEEIQYDFAYTYGYPYYSKNAKVYNNNHCENILIDSCDFADANYCIGTHTETSTNKKHKNIQVINCTANGCILKGDGSFIKIINTDGFTIRNNTIKGFTRAISILSCSKFYSANGTKRITNTNSKTGSNNVDIINNNILNAKGNVKSAGIYITSKFVNLIHSNINISGNQFLLNNNYAKNDIDISFAKNVAIENNDTKLDIKVDTDTTDNVKYLQSL